MTIGPRTSTSPSSVVRTSTPLSGRPTHPGFRATRAAGAVATWEAASVRPYGRATGKPAAHRVYLGRGVWADLTLIFRFGRFETLAWTYPDYADADARETIFEIRRRYLDQKKRS